MNTIYHNNELKNITAFDQICLNCKHFLRIEGSMGAEQLCIHSESKQTDKLQNCQYFENGKTKLFLDVDGVLLTKKNIRIAEGVSSFIKRIIHQYRCYWLTTHCKGDNRTVLSYLSEYFSEEMMEDCQSIRPTVWNTLKTETLPFGENFIWLDDAPFRAEIEELQKHNAEHKLYIVNLDRENELENLPI